MFISLPSFLFYPRFWLSLAVCVLKGHSGLGAWRGRGVWREYGGVRRQQFQSLWNPAQLPINLQSALLIQGITQHLDKLIAWIYVPVYLYTFFLFVFLVLPAGVSAGWVNNWRTRDVGGHWRWRHGGLGQGTCTHILVT